jgi:monoamine oxidase
VKREKDKVVITVRGGATYSAKVAVSCLPLGVLKQKTKGIEFDPPLSKQIKKRFG